jgi:hypothetical protein
VRAFAPLSHGVGAALLAVLAHDMAAARGDQRPGRLGLFAALVYLLMPGVTLSSAVMSTDGLLLPLWSLALLMLWRLRSAHGGWASALGLGIGIGLGLLAKYAMVYFLIGLALTLVLDAPTRRALLSWRGVVAIAAAAALFAPHMAWNAANSFKTLGHTADNANWGAALGNPENGLIFLADQMGVFGPIVFLVLLLGLASRRGWGEPGERWLLAFILPPLLVILAQAVISRAHANWAATAYPAASVLVTLWLAGATRERRWAWFALIALIGLAPLALRGLTLETRLAVCAVLGAIALGLGLWQRFRERGFLFASLALNALVAVLFTAVSLAPPQVSEAFGIANAFRQARYWPETVAALDAEARKVGASALLIDERENWHGIDYYGRDGALSVPLRAWRLEDGAKSYSEEFPLQPGEDGAVLVASARTDAFDRLRGDFATLTALGEVRIPVTARRDRRFCLYLASGFAPVPRAQAAALKDTGRNAPCGVP